MQIKQLFTQRMSHFESRSLLFLGLSTLVCTIFGTIWYRSHHLFEHKINFFTILNDATQIDEQTEVSIMGIPAGEVFKVTIDAQNKVRVDFFIYHSLADLLNSKSQVRVTRPLLISRKELYISEDSNINKLNTNTPTVSAIKRPTPLKEGSFIPGHDSIELVDLLSNGRIAPYLNVASSLFVHIERLTQALEQRGSNFNILQLYDQLEPALKSIPHLVHDFNELTNEIVKVGHTGRFVSELNKQLIPSLGGISRNLEKVLSKSQKINELIDEAHLMAPDARASLSTLKKALPQIVSSLDHLSAMAPDIQAIAADVKQLTPHLLKVVPHTGELMEKLQISLEEIVVLIKALEKSYFLKGNFEEVRKEQSQGTGTSTSTK